METKTQTKFDRESIDFHIEMQTPFKGLSKEYILNAVFNDNIQNKWEPQIGDVIVGRTGNIFVIGGEHKFSEEIGGKLFLFGGNLCNRDGGNTMDDTSCGTMNESGKFHIYTRDKDGDLIDTFAHSKISDFRFVPYPHETDRM